jgi:hypothetical protein
MVLASVFMDDPFYCLDLLIGFVFRLWAKERLDRAASIANDISSER